MQRGPGVIYTLQQDVLPLFRGNAFGPNGMTPFPVTVTVNGAVATIEYGDKQIYERKNKTKPRKGQSRCINRTCEHMENK